MRGEYLGGFRVRFGEDEYSLQLEDEDGNEDCADRARLPEGKDRRDGVVVLLHSTGPSSLLVLSLLAFPSFSPLLIN